MLKSVFCERKKKVVWGKTGGRSVAQALSSYANSCFRRLTNFTQVQEILHASTVVLYLLSGPCRVRCSAGFRIFFDFIRILLSGSRSSALIFEAIRFYFLTVREDNDW